MVGPIAKPLPPPPEWLPNFTKSLEGQLIADQMRAKIFEDGFNQGVYTMYAVLDNLLVWHYDELRDFDKRLVVAEKWTNDLLGKIEMPDDEQKFAEWLYEKQTGNKMERNTDKEMKPYAKDLATQLRNAIAEKGISRKDIAKACNISLKTMNAGILYNGTATKAQFDAIVKYIGWQMPAAVKSMYESCYLSKASQNEKFAKMEKDLKARSEKFAEQSKKLEAMIFGDKVEVAGKVIVTEPNVIPVPVKASVMPVDEPKVVEPTVEQAKDEELPFSDCNEMYKEAVNDPSAVQILECKVAEAEAELIGCESLIKEKEAEIEALKTRQKQLDVAVTQINNSINIMKEAGL